MKKCVLCLAIASLLASGSAWAERYRLAFSKAENIEIFVEHASKSNWCSPELDLRVVYGSVPDPSALAGLMPKLGALLDKQCAQTTRIKWTSWDSKGVRQGQGTSAKADQWRLAEGATATAAAKPSTSASAPGEASPSQVATETPAVPTPKTSAPEEANPAKPSEISPETAAPAAMEALPHSGHTPTPKSDAALAPAPIDQADFTVNGWKPLTEDETKKKATFLSTMQDQNGCKIVSQFNLGEQAQYVTLKSEGLACGPDGYAAGKGRLVLERSDGARLTRTQELWFSKGLPFDKEIESVQLAETDGKNTLWFALGHDEGTHTYYLLRSHVNNYGGVGIWHLDPRVDAVTEQSATFRQAARIQAAVKQGIASLEQSAMPWASSARLVFAKDFQKGIVQNDYDNLLYSIHANRAYDWRTHRGKGEWKFNVRSATNYLFQHDERVAREKRYEEQKKERERRFALQQKAIDEGRNLAEYKELVKISEQNPKQLLAKIVFDVRYQPVDGGRYARLVAGDKASINRIVRVSGHDDGDAIVDWPYEMRLVGQSNLKEKWYVVGGDLSLDPKRRDDQDLPLTLVTPKPTAIVPCAKDGCTDMTDPLAIVRLRLGDPAWTPEAAQALIDKAQQY